MKKRITTLLAGLVVALVLGMGISPAWSYFTDSHATDGGLPISVTPTTTPHEWVYTNHKYLQVHNAEDATAPVYVRAGVFCSGEFSDVKAAGTGWSPQDPGDWTSEIGMGWFYYGNSATNLTAVEPNGDTSILDFEFEFPKVKAENQPTGSGAVDGDNYNVIIVYESTPVQYDAQGNPFADWDITANVASEHHED